MRVRTPQHEFQGGYKSASNTPSCPKISKELLMMSEDPDWPHKYYELGLENTKMALKTRFAPKSDSQDQRKPPSQVPETTMSCLLFAYGCF